MINIGTVIGDRYEVIEMVGSGGMANVYRAKDSRLNRFVAVKVLKIEYCEDTKFVTKFRQEAQAIACLSHPNIVAVYDVGEAEGMHYIVMEFVDGITLKKYIERKGKLSVREAVGIGLQIANGLEAAHSNHIIHRDIKPQNILISKDGTAKVTDFGIAKAASSNTITASAMGSVHYISPEQARGGFSDEKSDIYSLGVTMYEMLSGSLPFTGESAVAVALAHIQEDATPLTAIDGTIPRGLSNIVAKCMQKKTELRYLTSADLITDLNMFLEDPSGEYGIIKPLYKNSKTIFIPSGDVEKLKDATNHGTVRETPESEPEDTEESDVDPKLEKALIIGTVVVAAIIGIVLIFVVGKLVGLWGGSSGPVEMPTPTAAVSEDKDKEEKDDKKEEKSEEPAKQTADKMTTVPDVYDMIKDEAKVELENNDLQYKWTEQESDTVESGHVIGTNPEIGSSVEKKTKVEVYISTGRKKVSLTNVSNYTQEEATSTLESAGYKVVVGSSVNSDIVEQDKVAYTDPKAGARVLPGATITLHMSKGPKYKIVTVPTLLGRTKSQAAAALRAKNLKLNVVGSSYSENFEKNRICIQSKPEGTEVREGTTVDVTLSLGPEPTYKYVNSNSISVENPFDYESDEPAKIRIVAVQSGKETVIRNETMSYSDFPVSIPAESVEGKSTTKGRVDVYKDGEKVDSYNLSYKKVAEE